MFDFIQSSHVLLTSAASLAVVHTMLGVDHSLPFVALGRARQWSLPFTLGVTAVCGVGHVVSSVLIGYVGIALGIATESMLWLESARGDLAATVLIGFGLSYVGWAVWKRLHQSDKSHGHRAVGRGLTPWILFVVFVLGPCEPLIPLMVVPGMQGDWAMVSMVVIVFGILTIAVMMASVAAAYCGAGLVSRHGVGRYADVVAGLVVAASGAAVLWLGV